MSMIERMARALADGDWDAASFLETPNGEPPEDFREGWREKARAAIEAMMEPTEAMLSDGAFQIFSGERITESDIAAAKRVWKAMLRQALKDHP